MSPARPTPANPETARAPPAGWLDRWKGGGGELTGLQISVVLTLGVALFAAVSLLGFVAVVSPFVEMDDVSAEVGVGEWQGGALVLGVGDMPFEGAPVENVFVALTAADGTLYYVGSPNAAATVDGTTVIVSFVDVDAGGTVNQRDRLVAVVQPASDNPLEGGAAFIGMFPEGFASLELP